MLIGVDVDQTIVPSCTLWENWLMENFGINMNDKHYTEDFDQDKYLIWWKDKYLYDEMKPYQDAEFYLNLLAGNNTIYFITKCFDEHIETKLNFCKKYFKFDKFFNTGFDKAAIFDNMLDYMIDDRPVILEGFTKPKCYRINYTVEPLTDEFPLVSWEQIYYEIENERYRREQKYG